MSGIKTPLLIFQNTVSFPDRNNIYFIIDHNKIFEDEIRTTLGEIFNGISLMEYRIAAYTTTGVERGILDFISVNWLLKDIG